jgi:hypothetical protein
LSQGYEAPRVLLLSNPNQTPLETVIFSVFPEDFADQKDFSNFMQHLAWFFPPHYQLSSISKSSELVKHFQPL